MVSSVILPEKIFSDPSLVTVVAVSVALFGYVVYNVYQLLY